MHQNCPHRGSWPRVLMVVNGFPETQPKVQNPQPAGQATHEAAGYEIAQVWRSQEKRVIGPARRPGQNDQQHAQCGAQGDEQQRTEANKPYFHGCRVSMHCPRRVPGRICWDRMRLARCARRRRSRLNAQYVLLPHLRSVAVSFKPIWVFYGLRALMRSATSR